MNAEPAKVSPEDPPGEWSTPRPALIPRPTYWPASLAFGITLLMWGMITSPVMLGMGILVFVVSLTGWIGEMRHEQEET